MKKYLRCHTEAFGLTKGALYQIRREDDEDYMIIDDIGIRSYYGINSDDGDGYYGDYFTLEFVPEIGADITVLRDESLGGIEREYREVKRKANVGDLAVIVRNKCGHNFANGDIVRVTRLDKDGGGTAVSVSTGRKREVEPEDIVVLEPTDIIRLVSEGHIDGKGDGGTERLRMVDRKAAVGERVIALRDCSVNPRNYGPGAVFEVETHDYFGVDITDFNGEGNTIPHSDYRVLEPVESAKSAAPTVPLSAQPALDQAAANIAALQTQVQALESRVATLEKANQPVKVAEGPADDAPPSFADMPRMKSRQEIRDEIVERAKADIEGVKKPWNISIYPQPLVYTYKHYVVDVEFVVNREKRTIVAVARWRHNGKIVSRGIAKCAPNDVFNVHLGKSIALHKALGLEVPAEYLNVPNPEEPRVGDYVEKTSGAFAGAKGIVNAVRPTGYSDYKNGLTFVYKSAHEGVIWAYIDRVKILDDSRTEVTAE